MRKQVPPRAPLVALTTRIPRGLRQRLRVACIEQDRQMQDVVAEALRDYLTAQTGRQVGRRR